MPPVKLGVIGCGVIGRKHIFAAAESDAIDLVAVADLRRDLAKEMAAQYGVSNVHSDAEALIADPAVEAVVLALPAFLRTPLALAAFAQGKHVLTEKPVAMNAAAVRQMLAAQGDLVGACCTSRVRFFPASQFVTEFLASGKLGNLRVARCRAIKAAGPAPETIPPAWRLKRSLNAGGIFTNWGGYDLDYLLGITGLTLEPQTVLAQTWETPAVYEGHVAPGSDAETHLVALIRCAGGVAITYERAEYVAAQEENSWEIIGDRGSLVLQMTPSDDKQTVFFQADAEVGTKREIIWTGQDDWDVGHTGPVNDFAHAIQTGKTPMTDLKRALVVQEITDAVYQSAESGDAVKIV